MHQRHLFKVACRRIDHQIGTGGRSKGCEIRTGGITPSWTVLRDERSSRKDEYASDAPSRSARVARRSAQPLRSCLGLSLSATGRLVPFLVFSPRTAWLPSTSSYGKPRVPYRVGGSGQLCTCRNLRLALPVERDPGTPSKLRRLLVPGGGVEPPRGCPRRILSPLRLPIPPSRLPARLRRSPCRQSPWTRCTAPTTERQLEYFIDLRRKSRLHRVDHGG